MLMFDEILKILGIESLDESQQTDIKEKLENIIDVKSRERADAILKEESDKLTEEYEGKFEDYKKDMTSKFSNFVDSVIDEELLIPERVMEYARKGELYDELIEQFKVKLALDENVLDDEVKDLLKEARDEISGLRTDVNKLTSDNLTLKEDAKSMASNLYLIRKCEGLKESDKKKVIGILGDITTKSEIDKKYDIVLESILGEQDDKDEKKIKYVCPECGEEVEKDSKGEYECPKCSAAMKVAKDVDEGTGKTIIDDVDDVNKKKVDESPFGDSMKRWKQILTENKI